MKLKYSLIFLCSLIALQLVNYFFYSNNLYTINDHFIFGYFGNNFLAVIVSIIFLALIYFSISKSKILLFSFVVLSSAVFSNILDRIIYGGVIDYIKIWFIPTFNLADIIIVMSVIIICLQSLKKPQLKT